MENQQVSPGKPEKKFSSLLSLMGFLSLFCGFVLFITLSPPSLTPTFASEDCVDDDHNGEDDNGQGSCLDPCEDNDHNGEDDNNNGPCGCSDVDDDHVDDNDGSECIWESDPVIEKTTPKTKLRNYQIKN